MLGIVLFITCVAICIAVLGLHRYLWYKYHQMPAVQKVIDENAVGYAIVSGLLFVLYVIVSNMGGGLMPGFGIGVGLFFILVSVNTPIHTMNWAKQHKPDD